jgi:PHD/YefM family antitoxin component YafN of YafNO toxin-antitoxin module
MTEAARRQRILRKAKAALIRAVSHDHSPVAIERAAEDVQAATLSLFKGQRELIIYKDQKTTSELRHLANFERRTSEWLTKSVEEIIRHCQEP